jgi:hypothetical protein
MNSKRYENADRFLRDMRTCQEVFNGAIDKLPDADAENVMELRDKVLEIHGIGQSGAAELLVKVGVCMAQNVRVIK